MPSVKICLFGKLSVHVHGTPIPDFGSAKARELLIYLVLHRSRSHSREKVASLLWRDGSTGQVRAYFRKALWHLHRAFESVGGAPDLIHADNDWVRLRPRIPLWIDAVEMESAFVRVRDRDVRSVCEEDVRALRRGVDLYVGDLLENCYQDWCLLERVRLQDVYLRALSTLVRHAEVHAQYETGIEYGQRVLDVDPARECAHRRLMRLRHLSGDRTGALRQYARCADVLDVELGIAPSRATRRLFNAIRADRLDRLPGESLSQGLAPQAVDASDVQAVSDRLTRIQRLQTQLADAQTLIERELEAMKGVLRRHL